MRSVADNPSDGKGERPADPLQAALRSRLRADLALLANHFADADRRVLRASALGDDGEFAAAEAERREAAGAYFAVGESLADLLLLLLRHALDHRRDALRDLLADALRPEFEAVADSLVRLEATR